MSAVTPPEFLVRIVIDSEGVDDDTLTSLKAAEARRAHELGQAGSLLRLWRLPEGWSNIGLWTASSEDKLHQILATLPLRPLMSIEVQPLSIHPNDPADTAPRDEDSR